MHAEETAMSSTFACGKLRAGSGTEGLEPLAQDSMVGNEIEHTVAQA
jgi:hypothetical protein